jgi:hypothetical protein
MFRLVRVVLVALIVLTALIGPQVQAAPTGGVVGNGTPASCTEAALTTALSGGGTVTFNCGGPKTILVIHQMTITQNTVIQGAASSPSLVD